MEAGSRNDARVRGNAQQLLEKYKSLARDAAAAGDRILAEYYMQHADHYYRVLAEFRSRYEESRPRERDEREADDGGYEDDSADIAPQGFAATAAMQTFGVEAKPAESAPKAEQAPAAAEPTPAVEAAEAAEPAAAEEEPRRRRRGRPRKIKAEGEPSDAKETENAA